MSIRITYARRLLQLVVLGLTSALALVASAEPGQAGAYAPRETLEIRDESQPLATDDPVEGDELTVTEGVSSAALSVPRPVLDRSLAAKVSGMDPIEMVRVIVYLDYLPHEAVTDGVTARYAAEIDDIRAGIRAIHSRAAATRSEDTLTDAENYAGMRVMSAEDRQAMSELHRRNEAVGYAIMKESTAALRALLDPYREPVLARIVSLGGEVEFTTIAGNTIVARLPAGSVP